MLQLIFKSNKHRQKHTKFYTKIIHNSTNYNKIKVLTFSLYYYALGGSIAIFSYLHGLGQHAIFIIVL